jgi:hypothetical protein
MAYKPPKRYSTAMAQRRQRKKKSIDHELCEQKI